MGIKNGYYSLDDINKADATYNIILSGRNIGKSYAVTRQYMLASWHSGHAKAGYLRRWDSDIKGNLVEQDFNDKIELINDITGGQCDCVSVYRGIIYFAKVDENNKIQRICPMAYIFALNLDERYKSRQYPDIDYLVMEEFVTNKLYLGSEVDRLMQLVSTIGRDRKIKVYMLANTISRVCPYFSEWQLDNIPKMEVNTIDVYNMADMDGNVIKLAVERAKSRDAIKSRGMFFGKTAKAIVNGEWETDCYPHLIGNLSDYDEVYRIIYENNTFKFYIIMLMDNDGIMFNYVYPKTRDSVRDADVLVLSDKFILDMNHSIALRSAIRPENKMSDLFNKNMVCFSDNLTASDFYTCVKNAQKNPLKLV